MFLLPLYAEIRANLCLMLLKKTSPEEETPSANDDPAPGTDETATPGTDADAPPTPPRAPLDEGGAGSALWVAIIRKPWGSLVEIWFFVMSLAP